MIIKKRIVVLVVTVFFCSAVSISVSAEDKSRQTKKEALKKWMMELKFDSAELQKKILLLEKEKDMLMEEVAALDKAHTQARKEAGFLKENLEKGKSLMRALISENNDLKEKIAASLASSR